MEPLYGKTGAVVGWIDGDDILDLNGAYRAWIESGHIYSWRNGNHVGWFEEGVIWDSHLCAVAMERDATASLSRAGFGGVPGRPGRHGRPGRPGRSGIPGRPGRSNAWSKSEWSEWAPAAV